MTWEEIARAVRKLRPEDRAPGDVIFTVKCDCGVVLGWTKVSQKRGAHKDAGPHIVASIPKQLNIRDRRLWKDIAGCTKGRREYVASFPTHAAHAV